MDISSCRDYSEFKDVSSFEELLSSSQENPLTISAIDPITHLGDTLANTLHIEPVSHIGDEKKTNDSQLAHKGDKPKSAHKSLNKYATFPSQADKEDDELQAKVKGLLSHQYDESSPTRTVYARSFSLPSPLNLVSAMKGSREKHGATLQKLNVTWAPDVYDPTPTSTSHTLRGGGSSGSSKKQQKSKNNRKNWKNGKKGQKGNSSRGKDKKQSQSQSRKVSVSGSSNGNYRSTDSRAETRDEFDELTLGSSDSQPYCGPSFLKNSLANMHYPVAEAL